ncbi:MAG: hypothetical protein IJV69_03965 [Kiritimatiellae bacterium]|nr:hypothetical protein [Kiritimatiellia bacterium]
MNASTEILNAGPLVVHDGCTVTTPEATYRYTGRVYILPEAAYHALLLTP